MVNLRPKMVIKSYQKSQEIMNIERNNEYFEEQNEYFKKNNESFKENSGYLIK